MRSIGALVLVLPIAAAGCISTDDPSDDKDGSDAARVDWVFRDFIIDEHDHAVFEEHTFTAPTIHGMAHDTLGEEGKPLSYIGELDSRAGLTAVAVVSRGSTPGFVVLDTADPAKPVVLGRAEAPGAYGADVKLTSDGAFALFASQGLGAPAVPDLLGAGPVAAADNGIQVWDLADPAAPEFVSFVRTEPFGCHMITIGEVGGQEYVWCINAALTTLRFDRSPAPALVPVGTYWPTGVEGYDVAADHMVLGASPHDVTFQLDPLDGTPVVTISHWDLGAAVLDVSDPLAPRELVRWTGQGAQEYHGYLHSAQLTAIGDKRLLVASPETLEDVLPAIWVVDVTDWSAPELVAEWVNPGRHTSQGLLMTTHQWQIVDGRLYLAYNHNGVWVLDLATILANGGGAPDSAEVLGVFLPHDDVELYDAETAVVPNVWDVNIVNGHILATDRYTGLHVLHYAPDATTDGPTSVA